MADSPRVVLVFLKFPVAGKVKTRLAAGLKSASPEAEAAEIYRSLVSAVLRILAESPLDQLRILFDPPDHEAEIREWLKADLEKFPGNVSIEFRAQSQGDLGDRLQSGIEAVFEDIPGALAAAIGTDCVEISPETFSETWNWLEGEAEIVFGPTHDGGYYLVAVEKPTPEIFTDIPWSTNQTLPISLRNAATKGRKAALLKTKNDVDTIEDWEIARQLITNE